MKEKRAWFVRCIFVSILILQVVVPAFSGSCLSYEQQHRKRLKLLPQAEKDALLFKCVSKSESFSVDKELMRDLIQSGANVQQRGIHERTLLHEAVLASNITATETLLMYRASSNEVDYFKCVPLHYAARSCNISLAKALLENGARKDMINKQGRTPEQEALMSQNGPKIIQFVCLLAKYQ